MHDPQRIDFLNRHFAAVAAAIDAGVDVRGFFVWSLMDNFEWAYGSERRFGIVHVDYATQARMPKQSARALQLASIELLRTPAFGHPFYWSAFNMIGDGY